jgi:NAD(P)H-hydrate repair Nnr-like enzyme with NAD(P)H-hydrate epimerase domain
MTSINTESKLHATKETREIPVCGSGHDGGDAAQVLNHKCRERGYSKGDLCSGHVDKSATIKMCGKNGKNL